MKWRLINGFKVVTKQERAVIFDLDARLCQIICRVSIEELEFIVREAKKTKKLEGSMRAGFFKHLNPRITFYFDREKK